MFCDLSMYKNNWKVYFLDLCKGINKLISTLLVHWNVWKYSDHVVTQVSLIISWTTLPGPPTTLGFHSGPGGFSIPSSGGAHQPLWNLFIGLLAFRGPSRLPGPLGHQLQRNQQEKIELMKLAAMGKSAEMALKEEKKILKMKKKDMKKEKKYNGYYNRY